MDIYVYDADLSLNGIVDQYESLVWTRRYSAAGEFSLLTPFTEHNNTLLQKGNLVMKKGDHEAGQIHYRRISKDIQGKEVIEVKGSFITSWLGKRIINGQISATDTPENIIDRIVDENCIDPYKADYWYLTGINIIDGGRGYSVGDRLNLNVDGMATPAVLNVTQVGTVGTNTNAIRRATIQSIGRYAEDMSGFEPDSITSQGQGGGGGGNGAQIEMHTSAHMIPDLSRRLPILKPSPPEIGTDIIEYVSEEYINVLLAVEDIATAFETGFFIAADPFNKTFTFLQRKGRDLSYGQSDNPRVIFSAEFDNVESQEYEYSGNNLKTAAYISGESSENVRRLVLDIGDASGLDRDEIYIGAGDISRQYETEHTDSDGNTIRNKRQLGISDYLPLLTERGNNILSALVETHNFTSNINPSGTYIYKEDFDVGDRVTCINRRWNITMHVRITEVTEVYEQGKNEIIVTFGDGLPTLFQKLRNTR